MSVIRVLSWNCIARFLLVTVFVGWSQFSSLQADEGSDAKANPAKANSSLGDLLNAFFGEAPQEDNSPPSTVDDPKPAPDNPKATSKSAAKIRVSGKGGQQLRTFCIDNDGKIYGIVGPERPYGDVGLTEKNNKAEIRVLDADGQEVDAWQIPFAAQAIAVAPNRTVIVAGNGRIAKFDSGGNLLLEKDAPHLVRILQKPEGLKEEAEANLEESKEQYEEQLKQENQSLLPLKEELAKLEGAEESEQTSAQKRRIKTLKASIKSQEQVKTANLQYYKQRSKRTIDQVMKELTGRLKTINALAVTNEDVFIASGVTRGYGYAVWRTTHEFDGGKEVVTGLSGCCGQMDIRCCENGLYVAENSRKRVLHFDRDGKKLAQWGEGDRNGSTGAKFGGCCNPMNLCFGSDGELFTAESEGYVKRYTKEGRFLGLFGQAKVSGGCKNVAIGVSPDGQKVYFYDRESSAILVLNKKTDNAKAAKSTEAAGS